jgi:hypothetical protein
MTEVVALLIARLYQFKVRSGVGGAVTAVKDYSSFLYFRDHQKYDSQRVFDFAFSVLTTHKWPIHFGLFVQGPFTSLSRHEHHCHETEGHLQ